MLRSPAVLAALLFLFPAACRAEVSVTVLVDAVSSNSIGKSAPAGGLLLNPNLSAWSKWARLDGPPLEPTASPSLPVFASRARGSVGVGIENNRPETTRLRINLRLPRGLWRVDAAIAKGDDAGGEVSARTWRMESVWRSQEGAASKTVLLHGGQTLFLRLTETVAAAQAAYGQSAAARDSLETAFLRGRVGRALAPVAGALSSLTARVSKTDRIGVVRKAHRALLAAAQAQAVWKNGRPATLADHDDAFDSLMTALSEISCAAYNLVPMQSEIIGKNGKRALRVAVTNAGPRTVPLVSLGVLTRGTTAPPVPQSVFGALAPGEKVAATFATTGQSTRGIVQFILSMGAAVVPASPFP